MTKTRYSLRIDADRLTRLKAALSRRGHYAPTITQAIERGIDLAITELEEAERPSAQKRKK